MLASGLGIKRKKKPQTQKTQANKKTQSPQKNNKKTTSQTLINL